MVERRRFLRSAAAALALAGFLAACKHWPAGQYDRRDEPPRDGGGNGY